MAKQTLRSLARELVNRGLDLRNIQVCRGVVHCIEYVAGEGCYARHWSRQDLEDILDGLDVLDDYYKYLAKKAAAGFAGGVSAYFYFQKSR